MLKAPSLAAGNVGNLPLVLVASLCGDAKSPISQVMGPTCESKGLAYVAFSMWVAGETWAAAHTIAMMHTRLCSLFTFQSEAGLLGCYV